MSRKIRVRKSVAGSAMVEFALVFPVLVIFCMAAADFGRLFFHAVMLANASSTGSHFGAQDIGRATQHNRIQNLALGDAAEIPGVSATATHFCQCPDDPDTGDDETTTVDCSLAATPTACGTYGLPRVIVESDVSQSFTTLGPWPAIPDTTVVARRVLMRAQ